MTNEWSERCAHKQMATVDEKCDRGDQQNMWRGSPELNGCEFRATCKIEAVSIASARKKAREFCEGAVYGSRELLDVQKEVNG